MSYTDWSDVDWDKGDTELSAELGVTRQRVNQARKRYGRPRKPWSLRKTAVDTVERLGIDTAQMTVAEVIEAAGLEGSVSHVWRVLTDGGVPLKSSEGKVSPVAIWLEDNDPQQYTINEVAEQVGVDSHVVRQYYSRWGIEYKRAGPEAYHKPKRYIDWSGVDWSKPSKEIAEELGIPRGYVYNRRSKLKREGQL